MTTLVAVLVIYVFCLAFVRLRNQAHLPLGRQMTDFSTFMVPFNIPAYLLSKLPMHARMPVQETFPQTRLLQDNWEVIRDEALALQAQGLIAAKGDLPASSFYKDGRWTSFYLKIYDNDLPSAWTHAPKTRALIEQVPGMNLALFAVLMPGKQLGAHHDPFAFSLRYSLGLSTPNSEQCGLMVNGEPYIWKDGEAIVFDETYLHSAYNETDTPRVILMTDIDRPLRWRWVQAVYFYFGRFFNSLFYIDNLDPSITGIGNRFSRYITGYKARMRRLKNWNRPAYNAGKWAVHLGVVALIVIAVV